MGFGGKNKKRESWSARPLSMILSDNVWLFKNKGRNSMEKAIEQQRGPVKSLEPSKGEVSASAGAAAAGSSRASLESEHTAAFARDDEAAQAGGFASAFSASKASTATSPPGQERAPNAKARTQSEAPPFLTLDIESSPQALNVPEQFLDDSTLSQEYYSQAVREDSVETVEAGAPVLASLEAEEEASSSALSRAASDISPHETPELKASPGPDSWRALTEPANVPARQASSLLEDAGDASRQSSLESAISVLTIDSNVKGDSYVLGSNRKIVVGRGVYIFDPADPHSARELQLTAAESYNPFDFE